MLDQGIYRLKGVVQNYAWGGFDFIPELLNKKNQNQQPCAELWMGAHQRGPANIQLHNRKISLAKFINAEPKKVLGNYTLGKFGESLPYLFKVLDVNKMLSIQVHPTKAAAIAGFKAENEKAIPLTARHRNYKDDNHKPEVMVALSDFYLLHGFRQIKEIRQILKDVPEFKSLQKYFEGGKIKTLYKFIMDMPQRDVNTLLNPLKKRLLPQLKSDKISKENPDYWAAMAFKDYPIYCDRGIFSIYFFNLVKIEKGDGIFQDAGIPHAYLEGINMELMANSDNVFRGGLTPKHIDVKELLQHLVFKPVKPKILTGERRGATERVFITPAPDFRLTEIVVDKLKLHKGWGYTPQTLIIMDGKLTFYVSGKRMEAKRGEVFFVLPETSYSIEGEGVVFRADVPVTA